MRSSSGLQKGRWRTILMNGKTINFKGLANWWCTIIYEKINNLLPIVALRLSLYFFGHKSWMELRSIMGLIYIFSQIYLHGYFSINDVFKLMSKFWKIGSLFVLRIVKTGPDRTGGFDVRFAFKNIVCTTTKELRNWMRKTI